MITIPLPTAAHTESLGRWLAQAVQVGDIVLLQGQLGAGKTTLTRALVEALGGDPAQVSSPTFTLMNIYEADLPVYHVDAYRFERPGQLDGIGFLELSQDGIGIVEWPERVEGAVDPQTAILVTINHEAAGRTAHISGIPGDPSAFVAGLR